MRLVKVCVISQNRLGEESIMSILKFEYRTPRSMQGMYSYLTDKTKTSQEGIFTIGCTSAYAPEEMFLVQEVYYRGNISHQYLQVIFAFDVGINLNFELIRKICIKIGYALILDKRQVLGAIHYLEKDSMKVHCHYLINYVGIDGSLYKQQYSLQYYKKKVNEILLAYGLNPIIMRF